MAWRKEEPKTCKDCGDGITQALRGRKRRRCTLCADKDKDKRDRQRYLRIKRLKELRELDYDELEKIYELFKKERLHKIKQKLPPPSAFGEYHKESRPAYAQHHTLNKKGIEEYKRKEWSQSEIFDIVSEQVDSLLRTLLKLKKLKK